ncbi:hypothetical protein GH714_036349 [Hevea brasiliensis]|uniref:Uncharacterized protein n=1 Tax=Hevea brasiliensis TaxID=3981 RepID=A0A6A6LS49_HEVBR|nr:hypothetical protein GH714_036349 [Hevea brasiliensis]
MQAPGSCSHPELHGLVRGEDSCCGCYMVVKIRFDESNAHPTQMPIEKAIRALSAARQFLAVSWVEKKQKQSEEEYGRKLQDLQAELASSNELRNKLERKVSYLQDDNALLENRQKEMQGTIQTLLQSRESFVHAYEESTCEMKRAIEARDRKLGLLSEKLDSHLSLFDCIEKETFSIKHVVDTVQLLVLEKEEVVAGLRSKMDKKNLLAKDAVIQNLISEKEALHCEVGNLAVILQKVKETVKNMDEEDKKALSSALKCQDDCGTVRTNEDNSGESSRIKAPMIGTAENRVNGPSIAGKNGKFIATTHLDSECSTTQANTSDQKCQKEKEYDKNNAI